MKVSSSPLPLPLQPFFCFRSNFRAITRLETLATQAKTIKIEQNKLPFFVFVVVVLVFFHSESTVQECTVRSLQCTE